MPVTTIESVVMAALASVASGKVYKGTAPAGAKAPYLCWRVEDVELADQYVASAPRYDYWTEIEAHAADSDAAAALRDSARTALFACPYFIPADMRGEEDFNTETRLHVFILRARLRLDS